MAKTNNQKQVLSICLKLDKKATKLLKEYSDDWMLSLGQTIIKLINTYKPLQSNRLDLRRMKKDE